MKQSVTTLPDDPAQLKEMLLCVSNKNTTLSQTNKLLAEEKNNLSNQNENLTIENEYLKAQIALFKQKLFRK
jgi:hypothetical protein